MKNNLLHTIKYIALDLISASASWLIFLYYRTVYLEEGQSFFMNEDRILGLFLINLLWFVFYLLSGSYSNIYRKSRLKELSQIFIISIIGVTIIFFAVLLDDFIVSYKQYYSSFLAIFCIHFGLTSFLRLLLTSYTARKVHKKIIGFNTLIIGDNEKAIQLFHDLENEQKSSGHILKGFVSLEKKKHYKLEEHIPRLGNCNQIKDIIEKYEIEDVIIAIESSEHSKIENILNLLENIDIFIKIIPDVYDILSGTVKMNSILGTPLIEINHKLQTQSQLLIKNTIDIVLSFIIILAFSPLYLICAILVKLSSEGPIIYKQKRLGQHGKEFNIYKFRSMFTDAEKNGPQLSSKTDSRVTAWGRIMRKIRLDETPQFFNVLFGDMSFVGPRPERDFFAKQILERAPHYKHIYKVKPGITSWGMVKYGYAENVDEMLERLKYDILYIENMSLLIDLKIMIHTILIILEGRGK
ncbi:MAG: sugar transferase [Flavobacteriales bacterium]|nr:sugar transferase [Flavobacteriales bacterium]